MTHVISAVGAGVTGYCSVIECITVITIITIITDARATHHHRPLLLTAPVPESEDTSRMQAAFTPKSSARFLIAPSGGTQREIKKKRKKKNTCQIANVWMLQVILPNRNILRVLIRTILLFYIN